MSLSMENSSSKVDEVLSELGLQNHSASFHENSIESLEDLKLLSTEDMKEIGLVKIGERNRLKSWIDMHQQNEFIHQNSPPHQQRRSHNPLKENNSSPRNPPPIRGASSTNPFDDDDHQSPPRPTYRSNSTNPFDSNDDEDGDTFATKAKSIGPDETPPRPKLSSRGGTPPKAITPPPPPPYDGEDDYYDEDDEFDNDDEALESALEAMNIDSDFACWKSFRTSSSISVSSRNSNSFSIQEEIPELTEEDEKDLRYWRLRLERDEVFSHRYRPVPREERELQDLAAFLGIKKGGPGMSPGALFGLKVIPNMKRQESPGKNSNNKSNNNNNETLAFLFSEEPPRSILLKRGPVLFKHYKDAMEVLSKKQRGGALWKGDERELILLTHGFILAQVMDDNKKTPSGRFLNLVRRSYDQCDVYTSVKSVRDTSSGGAHRFLLELTNQTAIEFQSATEFHHEAWLAALEKAVVQAYVHSKAIDTDRAMGWQHKLIQTSLFSAAVMGDARALKTRLKKSSFIIDNLDKYHKMSALHYATQRNHLDCMRILLEAGADVNIQDGEDLLTPMYHAQRSDLVEAVALLKQFGAKSSREAEMEQRGELFTNAREVEQEKHSHRVAQAEARARSAQGTMSENMSALYERGQKIEQMGVKTRKLQSDSADYANYAKQLKEKTKKQSRWGF